MDSELFYIIRRRLDEACDREVYKLLGEDECGTEFSVADFLSDRDEVTTDDIILVTKSELLHECHKKARAVFLVNEFGGISSDLRWYYSVYEDDEYEVDGIIDMPYDRSASLGRKLLNVILAVIRDLISSRKFKHKDRLIEIIDVLATRTLPLSAEMTRAISKDLTEIDSSAIYIPWLTRAIRLFIVYNGDFKYSIRESVGYINAFCDSIASPRLNMKQIIKEAIPIREYLGGIGGFR